MKLCVLAVLIMFAAGEDTSSATTPTSTLIDKLPSRSETSEGCNLKKASEHENALLDIVNKLKGQRYKQLAKTLLDEKKMLQKFSLNFSR